MMVSMLLGEYVANTVKGDADSIGFKAMSYPNFPYFWRFCGLGLILRHSKAFKLSLAIDCFRHRQPGKAVKLRGLPGLLGFAVCPISEE